MSKSKLMLKGSSLQVLETIVAITIGFVSLPLMQHSLGGELYGFWILIGGFTSYLYIFDFGFASSIIRSVSASVAIKDHAKTNSIISSALLVYSMLSMMIMLLIIIFLLFYPLESSGPLSLNELRWIIFLAGFSIAIEFPFKAFAGLSEANLRFDKIAIYRIAMKVFGFVGLVILLHYNFKLLAISIFTLFTSIVSNICFFKVARSVHTEMKVSSRLVDFGLVKELFRYSSWAFLIDINSITKGRIDVFFIAGYISVAAVSLYYVPVRLAEYTSQLLFKALNLGMPILTGNVSENDPIKFYQNLLLYNRLNVYFTIFSMVFFCILGKTIIYYWMGALFDFNTASTILLVLLAGKLSTLATNGFATALYAKALHRLMAYVSISETVITTILLYISLVILKLGPTATAISVAAPIVFIRVFLLPFLSISIMKMEHGKALIAKSYRPFLVLLILLPIFFYYPPATTFKISHLFLLTISSAIIFVWMYFELSKAEKLLLADTTKHLSFKKKN